MTNAEKYLKKEEFLFDISKGIAEAICYDDMEHLKKITEKEIKDWFTSKINPTLTEDERAILRHLKGFYYIHRATTGELEATNKEHTWCGYELYFDDDVFQFIKERRRI